MPSRSARHRRPARLVVAAVTVAAMTVVASVVAGCTAGGATVTSGSPTPGPTIGLTLPTGTTPSTTANRPSTASQPSTPTDPSTTSTPAVTRTPATNTVGGGTCAAGRCYRSGAIHELPAGVAPESSGIAASATMPGVFFVVDDGTGTDELAAVRSDGSLVARIAVAGMSARNAEALAAGPCGDRAGRCLYVGDIGDNNAQRKNVTIYRLDEPSLSPAPRAPVAADIWRYTYPDGPHNAEALVVGSDGSLLVLTKSAPDPTSGQVGPHRIYRAPAGGGTLKFIAAYRPPDPAAPVQSLFTGTVVTDASYTPGRMLLLTYDEVVEYLAPTPNADPATFPNWPHHQLPAPALIQSEGITADVTGCGYHVTSEEGPGGSRAGLAGVACD